MCSIDANCYAFEPASGKALWVFEGDSAFQSSPVESRAAGTVFVGSSEGNVYCLDKKSGKQIWVREGEVVKKLSFILFSALFSVAL